MAVPLTYSLRSIWVRRRTSVATAAGIGLVVFVLAASRMLAAGVRHTLVAAGNERRAIVMQHDAYAESSSRVRQSVVGLVAAAPGVSKNAAGNPNLTGETVLILNLPHATDPKRLASIQVRGVARDVLSVRPEIRIVEGRMLNAGNDEAVVGKALLGKYAGLVVGGEFELKKNRRIKIVGAFEAQGAAYESEVWADLESVLTSVGWEGFLSSVTVELASASEFDAFALALESDKRQGLTVEREKSYYTRVSQNLSTVILGLGGMVTGIFSLGAMLGAMITMHSSVGQRRREIGVLRALGFSRLHILAAFMFEALVLAAGGGALGLVLSLLMPFVKFSSTNSATGQDLAFGFVPELTVLAGSLVIGVLVGMFGGLMPAIRAARVHPLAALRAV